MAPNPQSSVPTECSLHPTLTLSPVIWVTTQKKLSFTCDMNIAPEQIDVTT